MSNGENKWGYNRVNPACVRIVSPDRKQEFFFSGEVKDAIKMCDLLNAALNATERVGVLEADIVGLLRDCVSETWGAKSFSEVQILFDKFLESKNLLPKPTPPPNAEG